MRNPVNRLATAAPRALDTVFTGTTTANKNASNATSNSGRDTKEARNTRSISFDLDLSSLQDTKGVFGESSSSVVTFDELADLMMEDVMEEGKWSV